MTEAFHKLARPMMRGVVCEIKTGVPEGVKNLMMRDLLTGMPQFKGEIIVGNPVDPNCREITQEAVDDERTVVPFIFWIYDMRTTELYNLKNRLRIAEQMMHGCGPVFQFVDHELIESREALDTYAKKVVTDNFFPGVILREPYGTYGTQDEEIPAESLGLAVQ